jgi:hypothetical protein
MCAYYAHQISTYENIKQIFTLFYVIYVLRDLKCHWL